MVPISNSWYPAVGGTTISSSDWQAQISDLASTLTASIANDGQTPILANLPMSGFKHTGAAAGTAATDYALLGQLQSNQTGWVVAAGTADAITATYSPAMASLTDGMLLAFRASAANATTTPTFAPNGLTAHTITKLGGVAVIAGDIAGNLAECFIRYNLANTRWELINPAPAGIIGTKTNDSASAGYVGEELEGNVAVGSALALTTQTYANLASVTLTAGDWDVYFSAQFTGGATTNVDGYLISTSLVSVTPDQTVGRFRSNSYGASGLVPFATDVGQIGASVGPLRFSVAFNTAVFGVVYAGFTVSTCSAFGIIRARRVR